MQTIVTRVESGPIARRYLDLLRRMRVCCFSETDLSILMWSHYGDQHRGVVLGFDSKVLEDGLERPVERVDYMDHGLPHEWWARRKTA